MQSLARVSFAQFLRLFRFFAAIFSTTFRADLVVRRHVGAEIA
jgi:hypothetical protein